MNTTWHFPVFIVVSFIVFAAGLHLILRGQETSPPAWKILAISGIVVIGGMVFAKVGTTRGWPVWIYYGVPALMTWTLPPAVFRIRSARLWRYVVLALSLAPAIHILFSFLLGWKEYMPFIPVPWFRELLG